MQKSNIIDITKSYLPGDPNAFPENLSYTTREDSPIESFPVIPLEAFNILPSSYGYRSYFGIDSTLAVDAIPSNCDEVLLFQTNTFQNMLVALCSAGVYTLTGAATSWTQSIPLTDTWTASQVYAQYTWCVIENNLYIYRQAYTKVIKISSAGVITEFTPTFLNMAGQIGIFRANGRLGFWDSANSIAWSSATDLSEFTPDLETLVGNTIFLGIQGRIINIKDHGEGFVIYCTKSIVGVGYKTEGSMLWDAMTLTEVGGVAHPKSMAFGENNKQHFVYTSTGIFMIGHFNALSRQYEMQQIAPELYDYLKESRDPVYLSCFGGRYLHFGLLDNSYLNGIVSFQATTIVFDSVISTFSVRHGEEAVLLTAVDSPIYVAAPEGTEDLFINKSQLPVVSNPKVIVAVNMEGLNDTIMVPTNLSSSGLVLDESFNSAKISTAQKPYGTSSLAIRYNIFPAADVVDQEFTVTNPNLTNWAAFANRDHAVDFKLYISNTDALANSIGDPGFFVPLYIQGNIKDFYQYSLAYYFGADTSLAQILFILDNPTATIQATFSIPVNTFNHIIIARVGNTLVIEVNNETVSILTPTFTALVDVSHTVLLLQSYQVGGTYAPTRIGGQGTAAYVKDFRVIENYTYDRTLYTEYRCSTFTVTHNILANEIYDYTFPISGLDVSISKYENEDSINFTFPAATFLLQAGAPVPGFPTILGSLVFDLQLKKWGKFIGNHKALISLSPTNETQNAAISTTNFSIDSGIVYTDGKIKQFSPVTTSSLLKYGKIGLSRLGFTDIFEVRIQFRLRSTGTVTLEGSLDGKTLDSRVAVSENFTDSIEHILYVDRSARWFTISISGQFDLTHLGFVGRISARR